MRPSIGNVQLVCDNQYGTATAYKAPRMAYKYNTQKITRSNTCTTVANAGARQAPIQGVAKIRHTTV